MSQAIVNNYFHVCSIWVCRKCGHEDWDINFNIEHTEKILSKNKIGLIETTTIIKCPKCDSQEIDGIYTSMSSTLTWNNSNNYVTDTCKS